jgi:hypothetical protein
MVPLSPLPPWFGGEDDACSKNANSSPTALGHAIFWALKAWALSDWPPWPVLQAAKTAKATVARRMALLAWRWQGRATKAAAAGVECLYYSIQTEFLVLLVVG